MSDKDLIERMRATYEGWRDEGDPLKELLECFVDMVREHVLIDQNMMPVEDAKADVQAERERCLQAALVAVNEIKGSFHRKSVKQAIKEALK